MSRSHASSPQNNLKTLSPEGAASSFSLLKTSTRAGNRDGDQNKSTGQEFKNAEVVKHSRSFEKQINGKRCTLLEGTQVYALR